MSIVSKIKTSVESATGWSLYYDSVEMVNNVIDSAPLPCAFWHLLKDTEVLTDGSQNREKASVQVTFVNKTEFDFNSETNEAIIEECKTKANIWLRTLVGDGALKVSEGSRIRFQRVYSEFDCVLTGVAVILDIEEVYGFNACTDTEYEPTRKIVINENGTFNVHDYYWAEVDVRGIEAYETADYLHIDGLTITDDYVILEEINE